MSRVLTMNTDGACSGNPGAAGVGVVIKEHGKIVCEVSKSIGQATNNIAEYTALVYGLQEALVLKADELNIFLDSELVCRQVKGEYKVKNATLQVLCEQVRHLLSSFKKVTLTHVLRDKNKEADQLATQALLKKQTKVVASLFDHSGEESPSSKG